MKNFFALLFVSALVAGCDKNDDVDDGGKSPELLLTQKVWIFSSAGFDDNNNGVIDAQEETIRDCDRDNTFLFKTNGTGIFNENALTCGGPAEGNFTWKFGADHTQFDIGGNRASILALTESELVYSPQIEWHTAPFIITYRH
jgi:hypothetical protein